MYKSGVIHTGPGESPDSTSRPTPRGKPVAGKPITTGKLLRPGGPGGQPSKLSNNPRASRPVPQPIPQPIPQESRSQTRPAFQITSQPIKAQAGPHSVPTITNSQPEPVPSVRPPPPPPPPETLAPALTQSKDPIYRAMYDFTGNDQNELRLVQDDLVIVLQKNTGGRFSCLP